MRPTKAQVAKARETITAHVTTSLDDGQHEELREACKVILDHTAPMGWTDHDDTWVELRAEARAWLEEHDMEKDVDIYMAGACREGQA